MLPDIIHKNKFKMDWRPKWKFVYYETLVPAKSFSVMFDSVIYGVAKSRTRLSNRTELN